MVFTVAVRTLNSEAGGYGRFAVRGFGAGACSPPGLGSAFGSQRRPEALATLLARLGAKRKAEL